VWKLYEDEDDSGTADERAINERADDMTALVLLHQCIEINHRWRKKASGARSAGDDATLDAQGGNRHDDRH
jgi:hypothetical protein